MQHHEFDDFIKNYRNNADQHVAISGESSAFFARYKVEKLAEWRPNLVSQELSILDYGCGDGLMTACFEAIFPKASVHGIDPSLKSIEVARKNYKNLLFAHLEGDAMPYESDSFDLISAAGVFHHIPFEEHDKWLTEIFRVLRPGGTFVLFELNPFNPLTQYVFRTSPVDRDAQMVYPGYASRVLRQYGSELEYKYYFFFPSFLKWMRRFEAYMTKIPFGGLYAVIVRK
jgi:ubiquinone/menaquinone biosynthesis C-methylase UbiE